MEKNVTMNMERRLKLKKRRFKKTRSYCMGLAEINGMTSEEILTVTNQAGKIPIDIAQICYDLDIRVSAFDFSEMENNEKIKSQVLKRGKILGAVVTKNDDIAILYRDTDNVNRRRFTLAHELAHCCLHIDPSDPIHVEFRMDESSTNSKETDANSFAGELLIPEKSLRNIIGDVDYISKKNIEIMSTMFMVSENVMKARLEKLKIKII